MPTFSTLERADVTLAASSEEAEGRPEPGMPWRILVLGDFSGRESREVCEPDSLGVERRPIRVDREDLDEVLARLRVEIRLFLTEAATTLLRPRSLEDFHPDRIFEREPAFRDLHRLREILSSGGEGFEEAARTVRGWGGFDMTGRATKAPEPKPEPKSPTAYTGAPDLVAEMLEKAERRIPRPPADPDLDVFVRKVVQPHLAPPEPEFRDQMVARVDQAIGIWMRAILHDPAFQAIEAAWRGLDSLLRRIETGADLQVFLLDVSREELARDLQSAPDLMESRLARILVRDARETPGASPWSAISGLYAFGSSVGEIALLARLSRLAAAAGAPFLGAAAPPLLACASFEEPPDPRRWERAAHQPGEELWMALRQTPEARFVGLAAPRFLLRLPYGALTDPTERFAFEEMEGAPAHEEYLWGSAVFVCLVQIATAASAQEGGHEGAAVTSLPLHTYERDGETHVQSSVETLLPMGVAQAMLDRGIMPVVPRGHRDAVSVARMQSIADPAGRLPGW